MNFNGNESTCFSYIQFFIKNDLNVSKKNIQMSSIIIGENHVPINQIKKREKDSMFEGMLEIKLRNITTIGFLRLRIQIYESFKNSNFPMEIEVFVINL